MSPNNFLRIYVSLQLLLEENSLREKYKWIAIVIDGILLRVKLNNGLQFAFSHVFDFVSFWIIAWTLNGVGKFKILNFSKFMMFLGIINH